MHIIVCESHTAYIYCPQTHLFTLA